MGAGDPQATGHRYRIPQIRRVGPDRPRRSSAVYICRQAGPTGHQQGQCRRPTTAWRDERVVLPPWSQRSSSSTFNTTRMSRAARPRDVRPVVEGHAGSDRNRLGTWQIPLANGHIAVVYPCPTDTRYTSSVNATNTSVYRCCRMMYTLSFNHLSWVVGYWRSCRKAGGTVLAGSSNAGPAAEHAWCLSRAVRWI